MRRFFLVGLMALCLATTFAIAAETVDLRTALCARILATNSTQNEVAALVDLRAERGRRRSDAGNTAGRKSNQAGNKAFLAHG